MQRYCDVGCRPGASCRTTVVHLCSVCPLLVCAYFTVRSHVFSVIYAFYTGGWGPPVCMYVL